MKRPLLLITIYFILGISFYNINNIFLFFVLLFFIALSSFILSLVYKNKKLNFLTLVAVFSLILTNFSLLPKSKNLEKIYENNEFVKLTGIIKEVSETRSGAKKLIIKTSKVKTNNYELNEKVKILVYIYDDYDFYEGEEIYFTGYLNKAKNSENPSSYNEDKIFKINNIDYKVYPSYYKIGDIKNYFSYNISKINKELSKIYYDILPSNEASILNGIILGKRDDIEQEVLDIYKNAGIYHVLAISGLHISTLALVLSKLFNLVSKKYSGIFVIGFIILYCILTGSSISTIRATIMVTVALVGNMLYKRYDLICSACLSALIILIYEPMNLFDIGFLYSFSSVFAIAFLGIKISEVKKIPLYLKPFVISFFVSIVIKPITIYNFYNFNVFDIFLNVLVLPFMSIIISLGFLSILIALINLKLATFTIGFVYFILRFFTYICLVLDRLQLSNILVGKPYVINIVSFYIMICFIAFSFYDKHLIRKRTNFIKVGISIFLISIALTSFLKKPLEITTFSFDEGETTFGEYEDFNFIIDISPPKSEGRYNPLESTVLPYLRSKGIKSINALFITNFENDYVRGVFDLLDLIKIENIFVPDTDFENSKVYYLFQEAYNKGIKVFKLKSDEKINVNNDLEFEIVYPINKESSLNFKINYLNNSILFASNYDLHNLDSFNNINIIKIPKNYNEKYIKNIINYNPELVIANTNSYDELDYSKFVEEFNFINNTKLLETKKHGTVTLKFLYNGKVKIKTYK